MGAARLLRLFFLEGLQMFIDTHCHLYDEKFSGDLDDVISDSIAAGVRRIIIPGSDPATSGESLAIARRFCGVFCACGVHPHDCGGVSESDYDVIRGMLPEDKVVACGEIGLDYHYDFSPRDAQRDVLARQIDMAAEAGLPVILHSREAHGDLVDVLRSGRRVEGVVHCFSDTVLEARVLLDMGLYIGFTGNVTFAKADEIREAAAYVPADRILFETDSPYLAPVPRRGRRNDPTAIPLIAARIAGIRGVSVEELSAAVWENAERLFGLSGTLADL